MSHIGWTKVGKKLVLELKWLLTLSQGTIFIYLFIFYLIANIFNGLAGSKKEKRRKSYEEVRLWVVAVGKSEKYCAMSPP